MSPGDHDPVGKQFSFLVPWQQDTWTVAGIVPDIKARALERGTLPQIYVLHRQVTQGLGFHAPRDLAVHTAGDPAALSEALRRIIWDVDVEQPISSVQTMADLFAAETGGRRHQLRLLGTFGGLAFLMAALGIHGVLSFLVSQRTREIGVRMALGARAGDIMKMILGTGLSLTSIGLLLGAAGGIGLGYTMRHLLFGVPPFDRVVLVAACALCLSVSITACALPAWRASRVDPLTAVQSE